MNISVNVPVLAAKLIFNRARCWFAHNKHEINNETDTVYKKSVRLIE